MRVNANSERRTQVSLWDVAQGVSGWQCTCSAFPLPPFSTTGEMIENDMYVTQERSTVVANRRGGHVFVRARLVRFNGRRSRNVIRLLCRSNVCKVVLLRACERYAVCFRPRQDSPRQVHFVPRVPPLNFDNLGQHVRNVRERGDGRELLFVPTNVNFSGQHYLIYRARKWVLAVQSFFRFQVTVKDGVTTKVEASHFVPTCVSVRAVVFKVEALASRVPFTNRGHFVAINFRYFKRDGVFFKRLPCMLNQGGLKVSSRLTPLFSASFASPVNCSITNNGLTYRGTNAKEAKRLANYVSLNGPRTVANSSVSVKQFVVATTHAYRVSPTGIVDRGGWSVKLLKKAYLLNNVSTGDRHDNWR